MCFFRILRIIRILKKVFLGFCGRLGSEKSTFFKDLADGKDSLQILIILRKVCVFKSFFTSVIRHLPSKNNFVLLFYFES